MAPGRRTPGGRGGHGPGPGGPSPPAVGGATFWRRRGATTAPSPGGRPRPHARQGDPMPVPLDEYPVHQVPLSMRHMATSDRNAYDRCYFNAHDRTGEVFLVTGLGVYPNLGVIDAYATVRRGDRQCHGPHVRRTGRRPHASSRSVPTGSRSSSRCERLRVVCEATTTASASTSRGRVVPGRRRAAPTSCARADGSSSTPCASPRWAPGRGRCGSTARTSPSPTTDGSGTRDRSWGIRPVGEAEPPGRAARRAGRGLRLLVGLRAAPLRRLRPHRHRPGGPATGPASLNEATRVWPAASGRPPEQLGWPESRSATAPGPAIPKAPCST